MDEDLEKLKRTLRADPSDSEALAKAQILWQRLKIENPCSNCGFNIYVTDILRTVRPRPGERVLVGDCCLEFGGDFPIVRVCRICGKAELYADPELLRECPDDPPAVIPEGSIDIDGEQTTMDEILNSLGNVGTSGGEDVAQD